MCWPVGKSSTAVAGGASAAMPKSGRYADALHFCVILFGIPGNLNNITEAHAIKYIK